jgi:hypothetical protein
MSHIAPEPLIIQKPVSHIGPEPVITPKPVSHIAPEPLISPKPVSYVVVWGVTTSPEPKAGNANNKIDRKVP